MFGRYPMKQKSRYALVFATALQGFLAEGLQRTGAGLGSVIIDSQPLTVALLAALLFGEVLTPVAVLGRFEHCGAAARSME
jgi:drug/metabolite transporter (DMT)-like permease